MGQTARQDFFLLVRPLPRPRRRTEPPLLPREDALGLPALPVPPPPLPPSPPLPRVPRHRGAVARLRPLPPLPAAVQREAGQPDALLLPAPGVLGFGIGAAIARRRIERAARHGRAHGGPQRRGVLAGASVAGGGQDPVAVGLEDGRPLRPGIPPRALALAPDEVAAAVPGSRAGSTDGPPGAVGDQAAGARPGDGGGEQGIAPFSSSRRCSAFCRVEWSGTSFGARAWRKSGRSRSNASRPR